MQQGLVLFDTAVSARSAGRKRTHNPDPQDQIFHTSHLDEVVRDLPAPEPIGVKLTPGELALLQSLEKRVTELTITESYEFVLLRYKRAPTGYWELVDIPDSIREAMEDPEVKQYVKLARDKPNDTKALDDLYDQIITRVHGAPPAAIKPASVPSPPIAAAPSALALTIAEFSKIVHDGLGPLYTFVGMVASKFGDTDTRSYYAWKGKDVPLRELQNPLVVQPDGTAEDFVDQNDRLGAELLHVFAERYEHFQKKAGAGKVKVQDGIGDEINIYPFEEEQNLSLDERISLLQGDSNLLSSARKQWVFSVIDVAAFSLILSQNTWGNIVAAHDRIISLPGCQGFTLKQLILSPGVREKFAQMIVYEATALAGGNAYAGRHQQAARGRLNGTNYLVSAGIETRNRLALQQEALGNWFKAVYRIPNPMRTQLWAQLQENAGRLVVEVNGVSQAVLDEVRRRLADANTSSSALIREWKNMINRLASVQPPEPANLNYARMAFGYAVQQMRVVGMPEWLLAHTAY